MFFFFCVVVVIFFLIIYFSMIWWDKSLSEGEGSESSKHNGSTWQMKTWQHQATTSCGSIWGYAGGQVLLLHLGVLWAGEKTRTWDKNQETIWLQPAIVHVLPDAGEINCQMPKVFSFPHCFNDSLSPFFPALLPKQINNSSRGEPLLLVLLPSPLQQYKYRRQA